MHFFNEDVQSWSYSSATLDFALTLPLTTHIPSSQSTDLSECTSPDNVAQGAAEQVSSGLGSHNAIQLGFPGHRLVFSLLEIQFSCEDFPVFGWFSGCAAASAEGPVQKPQEHWHPSRLCSRGYRAAADKSRCRHVLLSPCTTTAGLELWGSLEVARL